MFFYLFCVAIFLIAVHVLFNYNAKARLIFKLPSTKSTFIIGHALDVMVSQVELFRYARNMAAKFPGIYGFHAFPVSSVCIYNPEDVEIITSTMKHNEKSNLYRFLKPWLQDGLLVSKGSKWQQRRKILTSAFHFNVLQKYFVTIKDNDKALIEALKKSNGEPVDIVSTISEYTLNTICESAMGIKLREEESELGKSYKNAIYSLGKDLVKRFSNIFIHPDITFYSTILGIRQTKYLNAIHSFTKSIIQKRKDALNNCEVSDVNNNEEFGFKKIRTAMLDLLLSVQKHGLIDDKGVQEEVDTFMFEGHDTTAAALTYAILLLANHSDIQNKIVEELHDIFGNDDRDATMDDLAAMKYLELCLKESMRLYPPVPFIMRQITQPCKLSNFEIPNNTLCSIHIYDLHRNEKMFPDPLKFDPERFLPENSVGRHNYAYIPFSAGPRNCIGQKFAMMEMKSSVSSILRNFELVPVTKPSDIVFIADIVLRNTEPIYVRFVPRCLDVKQKKSF